MVRSVSTGLALTALLGLVAVALGDDVKPGAEVPGWGTAINSDGDCTIRAEGGKLTITVPNTTHDLWMNRADRARRFNGPRVMQSVEGDFVAQVKVTSDWLLGARLPDKSCFAAAGLVLWDSEQQYLRHERNTMLDLASSKLVSWTIPLYDRDQRRFSEWKTTDQEFFRGRSTWLRMERTGATVKSSISHDGKTWTETSVLKTEFPAKVQVGVDAISGNARGFTVEFEELKIVRK